MRISVCMATYNGAPFVETQILSILKQLGPVDQLIVVDDNSTDNTVDIVRNFKGSKNRAKYKPDQTWVLRLLLIEPFIKHEGILSFSVTKMIAGTMVRFPR